MGHNDEHAIRLVTSNDRATQEMNVDCEKRTKTTMRPSNSTTSPLFSSLCCYDYAKSIAISASKSLDTYLSLSISLRRFWCFFFCCWLFTVHNDDSWSRTFPINTNVLGVAHAFSTTPNNNCRNMNDVGSLAKRRQTISIELTNKPPLLRQPSSKSTPSTITSLVSTTAEPSTDLSDVAVQEDGEQGKHINTDATNATNESAEKDPDLLSEVDARILRDLLSNSPDLLSPKSLQKSLDRNEEAKSRQLAMDAKRDYETKQQEKKKGNGRG